MYQFRCDARRLLRIRELSLAGVPDRELQKRFRLPDRFLYKLALMEGDLPKSRCDGCGGMVVKPCRLCLVKE